MAIAKSDYVAAKRLMVVSNFAMWQTATDDLRLQHKGFKSYAQSGSPRDPGTVRRIKFTWNDGTTRCIRVNITPTNLIEPLDPTYQQCSSNFFPS